MRIVISEDDPLLREGLALLLRAATLLDIDCWTRVPGEPLRPAAILQAIHSRIPGGVRQ